jgi:hypothetical protein
VSLDIRSRIGKLKKIISIGGKGIKSHFCSEYKQRVVEMYEFDCLNRSKRNFGGVC